MPAKGRVRTLEGSIGVVATAVAGESDKPEADLRWMAAAERSVSGHEPVMVSGQHQGRLTFSAISHGVDSSVITAGQIGLAVAFIVLVVVLVDLVSRGRLRRTSMAAACFLACISPVIAIGAASFGTVNSWLLLNDQPVTFSELWAMHLAYAVPPASVFTGLGVVLVFILRLDDAWLARKSAKPL